MSAIYKGQSVEVLYDEVIPERTGQKGTVRSFTRDGMASVEFRDGNVYNYETEELIGVDDVAV